MPFIRRTGPRKKDKSGDRYPEKRRGSIAFENMTVADLRMQIKSNKEMLRHNKARIKGGRETRGSLESTSRIYERNILDYAAEIARRAALRKKKKR